jgi:AraC-like DNA-binding protein
MAGVIRARDAAPQRTLTDLAHDFDFADQAHLSREFRALSGRNPGDFFRAVAAVPETAGADDVRFVQGASGGRR